MNRQQVLEAGIGGLIAVVAPGGSQYAHNGVVEGWLPVPADGTLVDHAIATFDGADAVRVDVLYDGTPVAAHHGLPDRYRFQITIPEHRFGGDLLLEVRLEKGLQVGTGTVALSVDPQGNAVLAHLGEAQRVMLARTPQFIREGKPLRAYNTYLQIFCDEVFADLRLSLDAARLFAEVMDFAAANHVLSRVLPAVPDDYALLSRVGKVLLQLDRADEAMAAFERAIALDPVAFDARNARIKAIIGQQDWAAALRSAHDLRRDVEPGSRQYAELSGTIAWLYLNVSQPERTLAEATAALHYTPEDTRLLQMRGDALVRLSRYDEAIAVYRRALANNGKNPLLRKRLASALMLVGEFGDSADQDVGRMLTPTFAKLNNVPADLPLWRGQIGLAGKLLVWSEVNFGVGQNVLLASIIPDLVALGIEVVLEVEPRLVPVFRRSMPQVEVVEQPAPGAARGDWIDAVACHVPIGTLPRYFRRDAVDFEGGQPFLYHDPQRSAALRAGLLAGKPGAGFLVGFSWTSTNPYVGDEKSVPLAQLLAAIDLPGVGLVNLQYGEHSAEIAAASAATGIDVLEAAEIDRTDDLVGMCDLVGALDMVVCIGHTTAHFAGALGVPNLVLVPSSPFAHWLGSGERCVWYPRSRIVRQEPGERGDWTGVLARVEQSLASAVLGLPDDVSAPVPAHHDAVSRFLRNALGLAMADYDYEQIDEIASLLEDRYPSSPDLMTLVGDCRLRLGALRSAWSSYDRALAAGGDRAVLTDRQVDVLVEQYDLEAAAQLLDGLFAETPGFRREYPEMAVREGQILANLGRYDAAARLLMDVLGHQPGNAEASLALAHCQSATGDFRRAAATLEAALEIAPDDEVACALGVAIGRAGQADLGTRVLDVALARQRDPVGVFWRAQFARDAGPAERFVLPESEGTLPEATGSRVTVFVCMDTSYCMRYLGTIAASIARNAPEANLHVHIVNPHDAARRRLREVARMLRPGHLSFTFERARLGHYDADARKTYFASIRFVRLAEIMRAQHGTYFVMDADNIVRGDLAGCIGLTRDADVLIRNRFSLRPHLAVAACGIVLGNSEASRAFMDRTSEYILDAFRAQDIAWFLDQIALTIALRELARDPALAPRVRQLPTELLDWDFSAESPVWTGKGKRRSRNKRYLAEYQKYSQAFDQAVVEFRSRVS